MDIIERIQKTTNRISSIFESNRKLENYLSTVDQIIQYLVITSPVVAQYSDQFGGSETQKKEEEKKKLVYEDLTAEKALDYIKKRNEDITLVSSEKESSEEEDEVN